MQTHAIRGQFGFHPVYSLFQRSWMAVSLSGWYCHDCDPILSPSHSSKFLFQTLHPFQDPALNYTLLHFVILFNPGDLLIIHKSVCPSFALGLAKQQSCFFNWITGLTAFNLLSHFSPLIRHKVKNVSLSSTKWKINVRLRYLLPTLGAPLGDTTLPSTIPTKASLLTTALLSAPAENLNEIFQQKHS